MSTERALLIAQITDLHIVDENVLAYGVVNTRPHLERAIDHLLRLEKRPDCVIVTGDLVDAGAASEYARLREQLARLPMPFYLIPGNHDDRDALRTAFADHAYLPRNGFIQYAIDDWPVRLVALDTIVPQEGGGLLDAERLAWLDARLAEDRAKPTLIMMHHPPFRTDITHMDRVGLKGIPEFAAVIRKYDHVELIVAGHTHRAIQVRFAGTIAMTSPSTAHQVSLDVRPGAPATFALEPPGFMLHHWTAETGFRSHVAQIGDFPGPFSFAMKAKRIA
jgi:3',5'-cyclic AMP phosphodiesterase CpdA